MREVTSKYKKKSEDASAKVDKLTNMLTKIT